jgi:hypothetical protein
VTCDALGTILSHSRVFVDSRDRLWSAIHMLSATHQQVVKANSDAIQQHEKNKQAIKEKELQMNHDKKMWQASLDTSSAAAAAAAAELVQAEAKLDTERAMVTTKPNETVYFEVCCFRCR